MNQPRFEAVFISDIHLHPDQPDITRRFNHFIDWAADNTAVVYILGDFFHAWAGDDGLDDWSRAIAERLSWLSSQGVRIWYMHGNRDFLLGTAFFKLADISLLQEPAMIQLNDLSVLLVHGDRYCSKDRAHQIFRKLTRNRWFPPLFLSLPRRLRNRLVASVRNYSEAGTYNPVIMDVVPKVVVKHMQQLGVSILVHGHTHKQGLTTYEAGDNKLYRYVLSDWDDNPFILCYDKTKGFSFVQINC